MAVVHTGVLRKVLFELFVRAVIFNHRTGPLANSSITLSESLWSSDTSRRRVQFGATPVIIVEKCRIGIETRDMPRSLTLV
jgi:hypothetical protein